MSYFDCQIVQGSGGIILTVDCSSEFAGAAITATDGVTTLSQTCPSTSPYEVQFHIPNVGTWTISGTVSGQTYSTQVIVPSSAALHWVPNGSTATPTDVIQTWLKCADIFDKNYTTISQVLADFTTLSALINSNNASDYMARSTTWANSICADSIAMNLIGTNDYCSTALLGDSTWATAICNSVYFESVLNAKIPTMTSNTEPSGLASSDTSLNPNNPAYYAFDGNDSTYISPGSGDPQLSGGTLSGYPKYTFVDAVNVKKILIKLTTNNGGGYGSSTYKLRIKVSTDGTSWTTVYTDSTASNPTNERTITIASNTIKGRYLGFDVILTNSCWDVKGYSIQAYGRK